MNRRAANFRTAQIAALVFLGLCASARADDLWLSIRLAALPPQIELCRQLDDISQTQLMIDDFGIYEWYVDLPNGPSLVFYTNTYTSGNCTSDLRDATQVFAASPGWSNPDVTYPVVVDVQNATLSARIDSLNGPADLTPQSMLGFNTWAIYSGWGYARRTGAVQLDTHLPVNISVSAGDVSSDCSATQSVTLPYCPMLKVVGATLANRPSVPKETASAFAIGPGITGSWYDPNQSGHGLAIEVLPGNNLLAYWFTFSPDGSRQSWFVGSGNYSGNIATIAQVDAPQGGRWIPNFNPDAITHAPWGTLTFTFNDCNHGRVDFDSTVAGYGSGHMDLTRLTMPAGLSCP